MLHLKISAVFYKGLKFLFDIKALKLVNQGSVSKGFKHDSQRITCQTIDFLLAIDLEQVFNVKTVFG